MLLDRSCCYIYFKTLDLKVLLYYIISIKSVLAATLYLVIIRVVPTAILYLVIIRSVLSVLLYLAYAIRLNQFLLL